jgi:hypothetical protein
MARHKIRVAAERVTTLAFIDLFSLLFACLLYNENASHPGDAGAIRCLNKDRVPSPSIPAPDYRSALDPEPCAGFSGGSQVLSMTSFASP